MSKVLGKHEFCGGSSERLLAISITSPPCYECYEYEKIDASAKHRVAISLTLLCSSTHIRTGLEAFKSAFTGSRRHDKAS